MPASQVPSIFSTPFKDLPNPRRVWVGTPGSREEGLGKLSLLTPEVVRAAAVEEVQTGIRITLSWSLDKLELPNLNRQPCKHDIIPLLGGEAYDDVYHMNPQQSSQWDGLRHFSQPEISINGSKIRVFYGGTSKDEILDRTNDRIGMQHWAREGIAGRGVLLDYALWAERHGIKYSTFSTHQIKLADLQIIASESNITFQRGDILLVRIGVIQEWDNRMSRKEKLVYANNKSPEHAGVEATPQMLQWLWDSGFAALAGDAISWEVYPPQGDVFLHEYVLAGWGMPIGELFDLEELSQICKSLNRWTFFFTSSPLNMPGGVSSPSNAIAIF